MIAISAIAEAIASRRRGEVVRLALDREPAGGAGGSGQWRRHEAFALARPAVSGSGAGDRDPVPDTAGSDDQAAGETGAHPSAAPLAPLRERPHRRDLQAAPAVDLSDPERLNRVLEELDALPGLEAVADQVRAMAQRVLVDKKRRAAGLAVTPMEVHAIFAGPPGTGKTTVARAWGRVLGALGRLPRGHVVEVSRRDLVAGYVGQTAERTAAKLDEARGGVLFIDEAYALAKEGAGDFGAEATEEILKRMEDERDNLCVIAAGYEREIDLFLDSNPGLRSRFARMVRFADYPAEALIEIARTQAGRLDYNLDADADAVLRRRLAALLAAPPTGWANARSIRQVLDQAIEAQVTRLADRPEPSREELATLTAVDLGLALARSFGEPGGGL
ncbi:MAG: AAA family ATPase [Solirubrobacterales bacterium]|nr:AAA family ATPase [Solirubrobacterales bacterium]